MNQKIKAVGQALFVITMIAVLSYTFSQFLGAWEGPTPANGDTPTSTQFTLYLGRKYTAPGDNGGYEYFYSGIGYEGQTYAIISRVDNYGYSGSGIEIRVRTGATVYLGYKAYKLIEMEHDFIVLEEVQ